MTGNYDTLVKLSALGIYMYAGKRANGFSLAEKESNTFIGKYDNNIRFEIDDSQSCLLSDGLKRYESGEQIKVKDLLHHPDLYTNYPVIANLNVRKTEDESASFVLSDSNIEIGCKTKNMRGSILHEIQHAIQTIEGFEAGANARLIYTNLSLDKFKEVGVKKGGDLDINTKIELSNEANRRYKNTVGEIEARDTSSRMHLTKEDRKAVSPYSEENIPANESFKSASMGGVQIFVAISKLRIKQMVDSFTPENLNPNNIVKEAKENKMMDEKQSANPKSENASSSISFENKFDSDFFNINAVAFKSNDQKHTLPSQLESLVKGNSEIKIEKNNTLKIKT